MDRIFCHIMVLIYALSTVISVTMAVQLTPLPQIQHNLSNNNAPSPVVTDLGKNKMESINANGLENYAGDLQQKMEVSNKTTKSESSERKNRRKNSKQLSLAKNERKLRQSNSTDSSIPTETNKSHKKCCCCCGKRVITAFFIALLSWIMVLPILPGPNTCMIRNNGHLTPLNMSCQNISDHMFKCNAKLENFTVDASDPRLSLECELDGEPSFHELVGIQDVGVDQCGEKADQQFCKAEFKVDKDQIPKLQKTLTYDQPNAIMVNLLIKNQWNSTVWPVIYGNLPEVSDGGAVSERMLRPGETMILRVPQRWRGQFWVRTGCTDGMQCETGNCYQKFNCKAYLARSVAQFELGGSDGDQYFVSYELGFNVPIGITPVAETYKDEDGKCQSIGCTDSMLKLDVIPERMKVRNAKGELVGLRSLCAAESKYYKYKICFGTYSPKFWDAEDQNIYNQMKDSCPNSIIYPYDEDFSTFKCRGANERTNPDYMITIG